MDITPEIKQHISIICDRIADGESVREILRDGKPFGRGTFYDIINNNKELADQYARAMLERADYYAEKMIQVAETTEEGTEITESEKGTYAKTGDMLGHRRLKVDTYKWIAARMNPKKYGDKVDITSDGKQIEQPPIIVSTESDRNAAAQLLDKLKNE